MVNLVFCTVNLVPIAVMYILFITNSWPTSVVELINTN